MCVVDADCCTSHCVRCGGDEAAALATSAARRFVSAALPFAVEQTDVGLRR